MAGLRIPAKKRRLRLSEKMADLTSHKDLSPERRRTGYRFTPDTVGAVLDFFPGLACTCDDGVITSINDTGLMLLGIEDRQSIIGIPFDNILAPEYRGMALIELISGDPNPSLAFLQNRQGKNISTKLQTTHARELGRDVMVVLAQDMTEQRDLSKNIYTSAIRFRKLVDGALDMICSVEDGEISFINAAGIQMLRGDSTTVYAGKPVGSLFHPDYRDLFFDPQMIEELCNEDMLFPAKLAPFDGSYIDVHVAFSREPGAEGRYILEVRDVTQHRNAVMALHKLNQDLEGQVRERTRELTEEIERRKQAEAQLIALATHDTLTGLPNRRLLLERMDQAMDQAMRDQKAIAILFIDLDGFKEVNDTFGHEAGDTVLQAVSGRLRSITRGVDTVARLGGDEFVIAYVGLEQTAEASTLAQRILDILNRSILLPDGNEARIGCSIGIAHYPDHGDTGEAILKAADNLMYKVKKSGKNNYMVLE